MKTLIKLLGAIASFPFAMLSFSISLLNLIPMIITKLLIGDFSVIKETKQNLMFIYEIYKNAFKLNTLVEVTMDRVLFVNGKEIKRITRLTKL